MENNTESSNMLSAIEQSHQMPSSPSPSSAHAITIATADLPPVQVIQVNETWTLFFEKTISGGLHICIMIGFEIFFFFRYIIYMEKLLFKEKIMAYLDKFESSYVYITTPKSRRVIATSILNTPEVAVQMDKLYDSYQQGLQQQAHVIQQLQQFSFLLGGGVAVALFIVCCLSYRHRSHIHWKSIGIENIGMLIGLGSFQYIFFTHVILKYNPITDSEVQYWVGNHLYNVLSQYGNAPENETTQ